MLWLIAAIFAYFLLALTALGDKYLLTSRFNSKTYTFYAGILGFFVLLLIPFIGFSLPGKNILLVCFLTGSVFIAAIFIFYKGLEKFEVSRMVPAVGGLLPVFTFILSYFFFKEEYFFSPKLFLAFLLLVSGTFLITKNRGHKISFESLKISVICAFLFSVYFVLSKYLYMLLPFWNAFILIRIGAFISALFFIFNKEVKNEIFSQKPAFKNLKTSALFLLNQFLAASGAFFQNLAIALASVSYLAIINALEGIRYVFVFIFVLFISKKFPHFMKEQISKKIIFQKIAAFFAIGAGLLIIAL